MTTAYDRRIAQAAATARTRAAELADGWDHAAPRRPLNGHRADCPDRLTGPARHCRHCRADIIGAEPTPQIPLAPNPVTPTETPEPLVRACPRCFSPTTDPEGHCA
jgi:hypothetical protein